MTKTPGTHGVFMRIGSQSWNEIVGLCFHETRDRLADECVQRHYRPNIDTLQVYVHVPHTRAQTADPYALVGSVGWKVSLL